MSVGRVGRVGYECADVSKKDMWGIEGVREFDGGYGGAQEFIRRRRKRLCAKQVKHTALRHLKT